MINLGPKNEDERRIYLEENQRAEYQYVICEAMNVWQVTREELAKRLPGGAPHVERVFGETWDPTITEYAGVLAAVRKGTPL